MWLVLSILFGLTGWAVAGLFAWLVLKAHCQIIDLREHLAVLDTFFRAEVVPERAMIEQAVNLAEGREWNHGASSSIRR